jgi:hypothetical protein
VRRPLIAIAFNGECYKYPEIINTSQCRRYHNIEIVRPLWQKGNNS